MPSDCRYVCAPDCLFVFLYAASQLCTYEAIRPRLKSLSRLQVEGCPVCDVEDKKNDGERNEHGHVELAGLVLGAGGGQLPECLDLHLQEDDGILEEGAEHEEDAADDPGLHGVQAVGLWGIRRRRVENVHLGKRQQKTYF